MAKYLHELEVIARLNLRKVCEIFLGRDNNDPELLNHLAVYKTKEGNIEVYFIQSEDEWKYGTTNIDEFSQSNMDDEDNIQSFPDFNAAKEHILTTYGLSELRFVPSGCLVDEYEEMLRSEGKEFPPEIPPVTPQDLTIKKAPPTAGNPPPKDML